MSELNQITEEQNTEESLIEIPPEIIPKKKQTSQKLLDALANARKVRKENQIRRLIEKKDQVIIDKENAEVQKEKDLEEKIRKQIERQQLLEKPQQIQVAKPVENHDEIEERIYNRIKKQIEKEQIKPLKYGLLF